MLLEEQHIDDLTRSQNQPPEANAVESYPPIGQTQPAGKIKTTKIMRLFFIEKISMYLFIFFTFLGATGSPGSGSEFDQHVEGEQIKNEGSQVTNSVYQPLVEALSPEEESNHKKIISYIVKNEAPKRAGPSEQSNNKRVKGNSMTLKWGNDSPSEYDILGAKYVGIESIMFFMMLPCYSIKPRTKEVHMSKPLKDQLMSSFRPKLITTTSLMQIDTDIFPAYDTSLQFSNFYKCSVRNVQGIPWFDLEVIKAKHEFGGAFLIKSIYGEPERFGLSSPNNEYIVADSSSGCTCVRLWSGGYCQDNSLLSEHVTGRVYKQLSVYGITFTGVVHLAPGTNKMLSLCSLTESHVYVGVKKHNPLTQLGENLFMIVCKDYHIEIFLNQIDVEDRVEILTQLYTIKQIRDLLCYHRISNDNIQAILTHCVINIFDIAVLSPFESAVIVIPRAPEKTYSYLLGPALISELILRWNLRYNDANVKVYDNNTA